VKLCPSVVEFFIASLAVAILAAGSEDQPAPSFGHVAFPQGYREKYEVLCRFEKADKKQVVMVYGNDEAASVKSLAQLPYPYGSVIVMETSSAVTDSQGEVVLNAKDQYVEDKALGLHVMKKQRGFGEGYRQNRTGEWEYVEYQPSGGYITPPNKSGVCAQCHVKAGREKDFVYGGRFRSDRGK
jgi:Cytochrome P460